jgi:putative transposase
MGGPLSETAQLASWNHCYCRPKSYCQKEPSTRRQKSLTTLSGRHTVTYVGIASAFAVRSRIVSKPQAIALPLSPLQQALLQRLRRRQTADQRLVRRAAILLALAADPCVQATARRLGLNRLTVRHWRDRWLQAAPQLQQAEQEQATEAALLDLIKQLLADAPRPGTPAIFNPEQIVQLVAVACEPPEQSGRPIDHWTHRELADEVQKRGIVKAISPRSAGRFLKRGRPAAAPQPVLAER